jgi:hypothetical protein
VALQIFDVLKNSDKVGKPLSAATQVGQLVSIFVRRHEVTHGQVVEQPAKHDILVGQNETAVSVSVSTTRTRALIRITKILAPGCIMAYHCQLLKDIKGDQDTFLAIVSISALFTQSHDEAPDIPQIPESRNIGQPLVTKPTQELLLSQDYTVETVLAIEYTEDDSDSESDTIQSNEYMTHHNQSFYNQQQDGNIPSQILADSFHIIDRLCKTISRKHSALQKFATAFSDTLLVPDQNDKAIVEAMLQKNRETWDQIKSKSPDWLWKRVHRFIPPKDILHVLLKELFNCWAPIKCVITRQELFNDESHQKAHSILLEVQKEWILDPSFISVYIKEGVDKHGLFLYHCIHGTNSVEGAVHNPIRHNFAALNASPELADSLIADFCHCHNIDCGSLHKHGKPYTGHYDPWLDHDVCKLREDISWISKPACQLIIMDTDPLDFSPTLEKFGIPSIPSDIRINCNFIGSDHEIHSSLQPVYTMRLHLSSFVAIGKMFIHSFLMHKKQSLLSHLFIPKKTGATNHG